MQENLCKSIEKRQYRKLMKAELIFKHDYVYVLKLANEFIHLLILAGRGKSSAWEPKPIKKGYSA